MINLNIPEMKSQFRVYLLRLSHRREVERHFCHALFAYGFLSKLLQHPLPSIHTEPLPPWIAIPYSVENGRVRYRKGDAYNLVVTFVGKGFPDRQELTALFEKSIADCDGKENGVQNLELIEIIPVDCSNLLEQVDALSGLKSITLRFTTPLDIEQKIPNRESIHFDREYFDPPHFFKTLFRRLFDLSKLNSEIEGPPVDPPAPIIEIRRNSLLWIKVPTADKGADQPGYYGAVGKVVLEGDFSGWEEYLVLGQYLHVGKRTNFGFGRYLIGEIESLQPATIAPAQSFLSCLADRRNLHKAWQDIKVDHGHSGVDGVLPEEFEKHLSRGLADLSRQLTTGAYLASDLKRVIVESNNRLHSLSAPTVTDRIAQQSAAHALLPSINRLRNDFFSAHSTGNTSTLPSIAVIEQAYDAGYRFVFRLDIEDLFAKINWQQLYERLDAFFPFEPTLGLIKQWIEAPIHNLRQVARSGCGLPVGAPITSFLSEFLVNELDMAVENLGIRLIRDEYDLVVLSKSEEQQQIAYDFVQLWVDELDRDPGQ